MTTLEDRVRALVEETAETQEVFAAAVGLDATKLSKSLNHRRRFSSLDLARIAQHTGVTVDWLLGGDERSAAIAARVAHDGSRVNGAIDAAEALAEFRDNLIFLGGHQDWPKAAPFRSSLWVEQGRELADFAIGYLGEPNTLTTEDFSTAIEQAFGIDVRIMNLGPGCDGLALCGEGARILLVASSENPTRQRFTMAHELAHLLCRDDQRLHVDEDVMARSTIRNASEMRANSFAAHLLMPDALLGRTFDGEVTDPAFASMVMDLMVSPSSLAWRLLNADLVSPDRRAELGRLRTIDCASMSGRMKEYAEWVETSSRERIPIRLVQDCLQAYLEGKTTLRPVANLLGVPVDVLRGAIEPSSQDQEADFQP